MKSIIASYLSFTKRERNGIITLLILIVLLILLPFTYSFFIKPQTTNKNQFEKEIAALQIKQSGNTENIVKINSYKTSFQNSYPSHNKYSSSYTGQMFYFDPNTLSTDGWKKLGIKDKAIETIQKYLSKGGKFHIPDDIEKIWGLRPDEVERLKPYIQIQQKGDKATNYQNNKYEKKAYTPSSIDINTADTTALIALPGIGSKLAQRIITFREKLGGFYKAEQIAETFGLPDSTYQKIKARLTLNTNTLKQININTATIDELKIHPYIRYAVGNAIIQYRNQHGNFTSIEDIKKIMLIDAEVYNKINHYLKVE